MKVGPAVNRGAARPVGAEDIVEGLTKQSDVGIIHKKEREKLK